MTEELIRLSDAIKAIEAEECLGYVECQTERLYNRINTIPTIEHKHGEWIVDKEDMTCICSVCGADEAQFTHGLGEYWYGVGESNFCPNCGADMRKREDK